MRVWRRILTVAGPLVMLYGAARLVTSVPVGSLLLLAAWMIGVVVIHDGLLSPAVIALGVVLRRRVPDRGRRYLQAGLITAAMVTVIAIPMIHRRDSQPPSKTILRQNFAGNLTVLLAVIAAVSLIAYAVQVARHRSSREATAHDATTQ